MCLAKQARACLPNRQLRRGLLHLPRASFLLLLLLRLRLRRRVRLWLLRLRLRFRCLRRGLGFLAAAGLLLQCSWSLRMAQSDSGGLARRCGVSRSSVLDVPGNCFVPRRLLCSTAHVNELSTPVPIQGSAPVPAHRGASVRGAFAVQLLHVVFAHRAEPRRTSCNTPHLC